VRAIMQCAAKLMIQDLFMHDQAQRLL